MYHPGRVLEVFSFKDKQIKSCDATTQAMCEMWDENILTFLVDPKIADDIKVGDIVLVDYRPSPQAPVPRHTVIKILDKERGERVWKCYKRYYEQKRKREVTVERKYIG